MTADRWQHISRLYHDALARDARDRAAFLTRACGDDDALHREVELLLADESSTKGLLDSPAFARDANILSEDPEHRWSDGSRQLPDPRAPGQGRDG